MKKQGNEVCRDCAQARFYVFLQIDIRYIQIQDSSPRYQSDEGKEKEAVVDCETTSIVEGGEYATSGYYGRNAQENTNGNLCLCERC